MTTHKETLQTWNAIAKIYENKFMDFDLYNDTYDAICKALEKRNATILDIGCGPGNISKYVLSKRPDFKVLGIDMAPDMIELARKNNPTAHFQVMNITNIKGLKSKFDAIIGGFCLPYLSLKECKDLISDAYQLLNERGIIYLSFVEGDPDKSGFKEGHSGRVFFYYHQLKDLMKPLVQVKFSEIKTSQVAYNISESEFELHTILTARKNA
ncbi:class I SAM-dependent methyltransferase [Aestuariivivens sediminis]|uniref:class I SAM-dependent methyltransferase n=1 Tax=Aestuariivivens sediminis TaxID=2913557 RepID=UPI001F579E5D|nr:class I SAM-dependent methyltransferase [Aestuariivivens sediminis]